MNPIRKDESQQELIVKDIKNMYNVVKSEYDILNLKLSMKLKKVLQSLKSSWK